MKQKSFRIFLFGFLVCQFLLLGISFVLPNYVQFVLGKTSFIAGLMMLPGALVGALLAPVAGKLFDRRGPKYPILLGLSIACIGWLSLALFMQMTQVSLLVLGHVVFMIGNGLCYSNMMTMGMNQLAKEAYSDGNTIYNTLQQFSGAIATTIVAVILGFFQTIPNTSIVQGTTSGSIVSVLTLSLLLLSSLIASSYYFLRRKK
jgi:MFS family permease